MKVQIFLLLIYSLGFAICSCPTGQVFNPVVAMCTNNCQPAYYIIQQGDTQVCVKQTPVDNRIRATPDPLRFVLIFDKIEAALFINVSQVSHYVNFSVASETANIAISNSEINFNFLDDENIILEVYLGSLEQVSPFSVLNIDFTDTTSDTNTTFYFMNLQLTIDILPVEDFSQNQGNLLQIANNLDTYLEYGWTGLTLLNYYPVMYLYGKLYRETFNLYKMINIPYSAMSVEFFRKNDNKISGIKVPNALSILFYDRPLSSGWDRQKNTRLLLPKNPTRDDYKIVIDTRFHEFNTWPLFLDNFGIEITLFVGCIVIIIILEILHFFVFYEDASETVFYRIFSAIRQFMKWNFVLAAVIGAYPSLIFYAVAQIQAFAKYGSLGHNLGGGITAVVLLVLFGLVFPLVLIEKVKLMRKLKHKHIETIEYKEILLLDAYGILHEHYKTDLLRFPLFVVLTIIRSIIVSIIVQVCNSIPVFQVSFTMVLSVTMLGFLVKYRPYSKPRYNTMHIGFELINLINLIMMLMIVANQNTNTISSDGIDILNTVLIFVWILLPVWTLIFGACSLFIKIAKHFKKENTLTTAGQKRASKIFNSVKVTPIRSSGDGDLLTERQPCLDTQTSSKVFPAEASPFIFIPRKKVNTEKKSSIDTFLAPRDENSRRKNGFEQQKTLETLALDTQIELGTSKAIDSISRLGGDITPQASRRDREQKPLMTLSQRRMLNIMKPYK